MVPESAIIEWRNSIAWKTNEQTEQDLIICRSLVDLFTDSFISSQLAFRGGTALYKLFLSKQPRYSEDIDLVQINPGPIKEIIFRISKALSFLGKPVVKQKANNNTLVFRCESEIPPVVPIRLKIEINCREHFNVLGLTINEFEVHNSWFSGKCYITSYKLSELLGTKLRALYQRRKGRDLYDVYKAITMVDVNVEEILWCYRNYMNFSVENPPSKREYIMNIELKMNDQDFLGDTKTLLLQSENYNPYEAFKIIKSKLLDHL